ncbi:MAG: sigma 54-interacting transcriptional regulator [Planctomycetota bacterium]
MARILVIDDTPQNLKLIEHYLRGSEFEMTGATSGLEAIELCMKEAFDLILLDVLMPGIDGFEVCRRLKDDPRTAFVPVIFLTGRIGEESEKLEAYQLGAVDYIQKPVDREELVARIQVMLRLETARSRLDRENIALRQRLRTAELQLDEMQRAFTDLDTLNQELAVERAPYLLRLNPLPNVHSFDARLGHLFPGLAADRPLELCGPAAAEVARIVDNGIDSTSVIVADSRGMERELVVGVRKLSAGDVLVMCRDVTGRRQVEQRIADRAVVEMPRSKRPRNEQSYRVADYVGNSPKVVSMFEKVDRLRHKRSTVLVYGESGTGKELVARALHFDGKYRNEPFIPIHCGAIAPELLESELFGHEKGSFTGAQQAAEGMFRAADGGTIFLDEIAETSPDLQVKLLRVLQRGEIRPVGASKPRLVDVRIIAATNCDLLELVREGKFREDLFYRLQVVTLNLVPLRQRSEDIADLAEHFRVTGNRRHDRPDRPVRGFSKEAMQRLHAYSWPGNVRELENAIEGAFAMDCGDVLGVDDLPDDVRSGRARLAPRPVRRHEQEDSPLPPPKQKPADSPPGFGASGVGALGRHDGSSGHGGGFEPPPKELEIGDGTEREREPRDFRRRSEQHAREAFREALRRTDGDKAAAAKLLGIARSTFYRRCKEMDL